MPSFHIILVRILRLKAADSNSQEELKFYSAATIVMVWDMCVVEWLHVRMPFDVTIFRGWGGAVSQVGEERGRKFLLRHTNRERETRKPDYNINNN